LSRHTIIPQLKFLVHHREHH